MGKDKIQETDEGYYEQHGDVLEWRWKGQPSIDEPQPVTTGTAEAVVPKKRAARKRATAKRGKK